MTTEQTPSAADLAKRMKDLWTLLTEEERQNVSQAASIKTFKKNEPIYREGESPDSLYAILCGKVKIYRDGVGGRSQIIRVLKPTQYFGYRASMAQEPYVTGAAAFEPSVICCIPMRLIHRILAENNGLCRFFITELATDLGISDRRTVSLTQKHIRGRLAESLLYLKEIYGICSRDHSLAIRLTREDLAGLSNMTTSNAIRTLSNFAEEGLVAIQGKSIIILDEEKLAHISQCG